MNGYANIDNENKPFTLKKSLTLVVAVYNAVKYLEFVFAALQRQTFTDFEVIVADDGSGPAMKELIDTASPRLPFPVKHVWQPDSGFRKNAILNKAITAAETNYLIFIDGDCVPHHEFIRDHAEHRKEMGILCGRRVNYSKQITERLTLDHIQAGRFERLSPSVLLDGLMARSSNLEDAIRLESSFLRTLLHWNKARILGCNFSVQKDLLQRINGFNEDYQAPGLGEDSDIGFRMELIGAKLLTLLYLAVVYHMYHPATLVGDANKKIYENVVATKQIICQNGLKKMS